MTRVAPAVPVVPDAEVADLYAVLADLAAQVAALREVVAGRVAGPDVVGWMKAGYETALRDLARRGCSHVPAPALEGRARLALVPPQGGVA